MKKIRVPKVIDYEHLPTKLKFYVIFFYILKAATPLPII